MPQAVRPDAQLVMHAEPWQICPAGQALPQAPQLARSLVRLTHTDPQAVWPAGHAIPQAPAMHT